MIRRFSFSSLCVGEAHESSVVAVGVETDAYVHGDIPGVPARTAELPRHPCLERLSSVLELQCIRNINPEIASRHCSANTLDMQHIELIEPCDRSTFFSPFPCRRVPSLTWLFSFPPMFASVSTRPSLAHPWSARETPS